MIAAGLILFALIPKPRTTPQLVMFSAPATRTVNLFPQLSAAMGVRLEVSPQLADEVLVIRVKDVAGMDLMQRIAQVTHATWEADGPAYKLVRTSAINEKLREIDIDERTADIQARLNAAAKLPAPKPPSQTASDGQVAYKAQQASSKERIVALLNAIGAANLARLDPDTRTVFASRPTTMQAPLPGADSPAVQSLLAYYATDQPHADLSGFEQIEGRTYATSLSLPLPTSKMPTAYADLPDTFRSDTEGMLAAMQKTFTHPVSFGRHSVNP